MICCKFLARRPQVDLCENVWHVLRFSFWQICQSHHIMAKSKCFGLQKKRGQMRSLCASVAMCVLFVRDPPQIPNFVIKNIGALQRNLVLRVSQRLCSQFIWPNFIIIYHIIHHNISCSLSLLSTRARTYSKRLRSWSRWVPPRTLWRAERSFYKGRFVERSH